MDDNFLLFIDLRELLGAGTLLLDGDMAFEQGIIATIGMFSSK